MDQGIYVIRCSVSGKVYVGSSKKMHERWMEHKRSLRNNKHHSQHLQRAWNKYGEKAFEFQIVEEILDPLDLICREQKWIDTCDSFKNGYNGRQEADVCSWFRNHAKLYILRFPDGSEIKVKNLKDHCYKNNLNQGAMSAVARHQSNHHKNINCRRAEETFDQWQSLRAAVVDESKANRKPPSTYTYTWKVIYPDGREVIVDSLTAFCNQYNLSQGNLAEVARGNRKQHKGYRCEFVNQITH